MLLDNLLQRLKPLKSTEGLQLLGCLGFFFFLFFPLPPGLGFHRGSLQPCLSLPITDVLNTQLKHTLDLFYRSLRAERVLAGTHQESGQKDDLAGASHISPFLGNYLHSLEHPFLSFLFLRTPDNVSNSPEPVCNPPPPSDAHRHHINCQWLQ